MNSILRTVLILLSLINFSCSSLPVINVTHVREATVHADSKSVFYSNNNMQETNVSSLMKSKIKLPEKIKIAIINLKPAAEENYKDFQIKRNLSRHIKNDTTSYLLAMLAGREDFHRRQIESFLVPESLVPTKSDIKWIRNLGATMQADLVLVIDSRNDKFHDQEVIKKNEVLTTASADTYLIDTRTGAIINTSTYRRDSYLEKKPDDLTVYHTLDRARSISEKKIFKKLVADVRNTVESIE
jgi:hypothetical protein